jgi:hypothetical protein
MSEPWSSMQAQKNKEEHSSEWMETSAQKRFDRADTVIALGKAWKRRNRR